MEKFDATEHHRMIRRFTAGLIVREIDRCGLPPRVIAAALGWLPAQIDWLRRGEVDTFSQLELEQRLVRLQNARRASAQAENSPAEVLAFLGAGEGLKAS